MGSEQPYKSILELRRGEVYRGKLQVGTLTLNQSNQSHVEPCRTTPCGASYTTAREEAICSQRFNLHRWINAHKSSHNKSHSTSVPTSLYLLHYSSSFLSVILLLSVELVANVSCAVVHFFAHTTSYSTVACCVEYGYTPAAFCLPSFFT